MSKVELFKDVKNSLGEGITWSSLNSCIYWLDIMPKSVLFKIDLYSNKLETFDLPEFVTASSIISNNEIALISNNGVNRFDFNTNSYEIIIDVEKDIPLNRSNDGASDARGRLWFGTMQNNFNKDGSAKSLDTKTKNNNTNKPISLFINMRKPVKMNIEFFSKLNITITANNIVKGSG